MHTESQANQEVQCETDISNTRTASEHGNKFPAFRNRLNEGAIERLAKPQRGKGRSSAF